MKVSLDIYNYPRWRWHLRKISKFFFEKVFQCQKSVNEPTPYPYTLQKPIVFYNKSPITFSYLDTMLNTLGLYPRPKTCRQSIRNEHQRPLNEHERPLNFVSQSETSITSPKNTRELSARVEDPSWPSALGSLRLAIAYLIT